MTLALTNAVAAALNRRVRDGASTERGGYSAMISINA